MVRAIFPGTFSKKGRRRTQEDRHFDITDLAAKYRSMNMDPPAHLELNPCKFITIFCSFH